MFDDTISGHKGPRSDLVGAPAGKVDAPVVQFQLGVSGSVGAVKTNIAALRDGQK